MLRSCDFLLKQHVRVSLSMKWKAGEGGSPSSTGHHLMNPQILQRWLTRRRSGQSSIAAIHAPSASHGHRVQPCSAPTLCELAPCPRRVGEALAREGRLGRSQRSLE